MHRITFRCWLLPSIVFCSLWITPVAASDPLPSWNEGLTKRQIIEFVHSVTAPRGPHFVPVSQRIATFDNDGTLWSEQPAYFQLQFSIHRTRQLAGSYPEWKNTQPFQAALENDLVALTSGNHRGFLALTAATCGNLTVNELHSEVAAWLKSSRHPRFKRPYTDLVFQPMLELLAYLKGNHFSSYIVSGGDLEFMRAWAPRVYGIPPERIIGSRLKTQAIKRDGKPALLRLPEFEFFNNASGKPISIRKVIGRRPIAAFGNSDGDLQMLEWTTTGSSQRLGVIIRHTDAQREWSYDRKSLIGHLDKALDKAAMNKWTVVDMKRDWRVIYPFQLKR